MNTGSRREGAPSSSTSAPDLSPLDRADSGTGTTHAPGAADGPGTTPDRGTDSAPTEPARSPVMHEAVEAVAESGTPRAGSDDDIPTADRFPFAPRTLTRAMAARAAKLGLQLPKPRLRGILHLIAFPSSLVVGLLLVAVGDTLAIRLACAVFVLTAGMLFGISAVYHRGTWSPQRAIMLRRFDHANIFLIIAGTYTPLAIALLPPRQAATLLAIAWGGALIGVGFRVFWTGAPRWLYVPAYIALGWVAVFYMPQFHAAGGWPVVWLLAVGGLAYTLGAVVYGLKRPNPSPAWFGFHEIFHAGTLAGFGCHFAAVAISVL
jgi:hemolysin III